MGGALPSQMRCASTLVHSRRQEPNDDLAILFSGGCAIDEAREATVLLAMHNTNLIRGCVTPTVLHNWAESSEMDMELIDGYDVLPPGAQETVKRALEQGHVDDDDWNGVQLAAQ